MKKIFFIFGTRPEAIKMAPVINEFKKYPKTFEVKVCITSQHKHILNEFLTLFQIEADYDLEIMRESQTLFDITTGILSRVENILRKEAPDLLFVQGDTTSSFTASLAAFYLKIPVAHVEAGLRTGDKYQPFPEEINRRLTGAIADIHFPPTKQAKNNLLKEGIPENKIYVTGNTVIDALFYIAEIS